MREECFSVIDAIEKCLGNVESLKAFQLHEKPTRAEKCLPLFLPENRPPTSGPLSVDIGSLNAVSVGSEDFKLQYQRENWKYWLVK